MQTDGMGTVRMRRYAWIVKLYIATGVCGCVNQVTQQSTLHLRPNATLDEVLGAFSFAFELQSSQICNNPADRALVDAVKNRLVAALQQTDEYAAIARDTQWDIQIVVDDDPNAAAFPGGGIIVNTGLLDQYARWEEGYLAVALSHELMHVVKGHLAQRLRKDKALFDEVTKGVDLEHMSSATALRILVELGIGELTDVVPFVKDQELEADSEGLALMALAGYEPSLAPDFWNKLAHASAQQSGFSLTHPTTPDRIAMLELQLQTKYKLAGVAPSNRHCDRCERPTRARKPVLIEAAVAP
jgi:predicted Zn-dependent protease